MLGFLEKLTLHPGTIGPDDIRPLRSVGLSDTAIEDAIYVCVYFNIIDRIADSLGFTVPPAEVFAATAASPATSSYALPPT
jgi:alkylhydroperoxidase family enzyme